MMVFLVGAGTLAFYQVMALEDQLDQVTRAIDQMDGKVKHAQYEKAKFYAIARDLVRMAPKSSAAAQIVEDSNLRRLQAAQPALMSLDAPAGFSATDPASSPPAPAPANSSEPPASSVPKP